MILDLNSDIDTVKAYVRTRAAAFAETSNSGPGRPDDLIRMILLGYSFEQSGWYSLVFDTRPNAVRDGAWQAHIQENWVEAPHWCMDYVHHYDKFGVVYDPARIPKGKAYTTNFFARLFGNFCCDVLTQSRDEGAFRDLPLDDGCTIAVEEHEVRWGWPKASTPKKHSRATA